MMIVLVGVCVDQCLVFVSGRLFAQYLFVQITETQDEVRHAGIERDAIGRIDSLIAQKLEERQLCVIAFEDEDFTEDGAHS